MLREKKDFLFYAANNWFFCDSNMIKHFKHLAFFMVLSSGVLAGRDGDPQPLFREKVQNSPKDLKSDLSKFQLLRSSTDQTSISINFEGLKVQNPEVQELGLGYRMLADYCESHSDKKDFSMNDSSPSTMKNEMKKFIREIVPQPDNNIFDKIHVTHDEIKTLSGFLNIEEKDFSLPPKDFIKKNQIFTFDKHRDDNDESAKISVIFSSETTQELIDTLDVYGMRGTSRIMLANIPEDLFDFLKKNPDFKIKLPSLLRKHKVILVGKPFHCVTREQKNILQTITFLSVPPQDNPKKECVLFALKFAVGGLLSYEDLSSCTYKSESKSIFSTAKALEYLRHSPAKSKFLYELASGSPFKSLLSAKVDNSFFKDTFNRDPKINDGSILRNAFYYLFQNIEVNNFEYFYRIIAEIIYYNKDKEKYKDFNFIKKQFPTLHDALNSYPAIDQSLRELTPNYKIFKVINRMNDDFDPSENFSTIKENDEKLTEYFEELKGENNFKELNDLKKSLIRKIGDLSDKEALNFLPQLVTIFNTILQDHIIETLGHKSMAEIKKTMRKKEAPGMLGSLFGKEKTELEFDIDAFKVFWEENNSYGPTLDFQTLSNSKLQAPKKSSLTTIGSDDKRNPSKKFR